MKDHVLRTTLHLAVPKDRVFAFFADATNLARITPPDVSFRIRTPLPITFQVGTLIDYSIGLHGVPGLGCARHIAVDSGHQGRPEIAGVISASTAFGEVWVKDWTAAGLIIRQLGTFAAADIEGLRQVITQLLG